MIPALGALARRARSPALRSRAPFCAPRTLHSGGAAAALSSAEAARAAGPRCGRRASPGSFPAAARRSFSSPGAAAPGPSKYEVEITSANFEAEVMGERGCAVVLDCYADWCGPCKQLKPILVDAVNKAGGKLKLACLNTDAEQEVSLSSARHYHHRTAVIIFYMR